MRGLSLFGRVTSVKTFLIPKLLNVSSIIQTPMEIMKRMERMIFKHLWKGPDKVTRNSVINSVKNGGLNLMDIETQIKALRLSWIPRILDITRRGPWKSYFNHYLKPYGGTFSFTKWFFIQVYFFGGRSLETHFPITIMHKGLFGIIRTLE